MKSKVLIFVSILLMLFACNDDAINNHRIDGDYIGTFEKNGENSAITLKFDNGTFTGTSEIQKFPAICKGTYVISNNLVNFKNECVWTAEFDWSLILSGEWNYNLEGKDLVLTNSNGSIYNLTKK